jgi:hypothetical protein
MWAVLGLGLVSFIAALIIVVVGREAPPLPHETPWELADNARKMVGIASALAGINITGVVLLLSFARDPDSGIGTPLSAAVGMFLVAFISLVLSALMFANLTRADVMKCGVNVQSMQYAVTVMVLFRSIFLGWLGLRPLVEAYELQELADQIGWLLLASAVLGGLTMSVAILHRLSLVGGRVVVLVPLLGLVGCGLAALLFEMFPDARSDVSALYLAYALFALNALSFTGYAVLPPALEHERFGPVIARWWGLGMAVVGVVSALTIGFIWLAVMGAV